MCLCRFSFFPSLIIRCIKDCVTFFLFPLRSHSKSSASFIPSNRKRRRLNQRAMNDWVIIFSWRWNQIQVQRKTNRIKCDCYAKDRGTETNEGITKRSLKHKLSRLLCVMKFVLNVGLKKSVENLVAFVWREVSLEGKLSLSFKTNRDSWVLKNK